MTAKLVKLDGHTAVHVKSGPTWSESMPMNQSGEGTMRVTSETRLWLPSTKHWASLLPDPLFMGGKENSSKTEAFPVKPSMSLWPVSTNCFTTGEAWWPILNRWNVLSWVRPVCVYREKKIIIIVTRTLNGNNNKCRVRKSFKYATTLEN